MTKPLYTREILQAAMALADYPFDTAMPRKVEMRSKTCGSVVWISLSVDQEKRISDIGVKAQACALGQASAAVLTRHIKGRSRSEIDAAGQALSDYLHGKIGRPGTWPEADMLMSAHDYPARRDSVLLPWRAALAAMDEGKG
ncbi:iron-sulfur cluster assembly scaffold protein [Sphingorhabdus sp. Alg239-R122]|uniref:iron-sulfur cluster assembly scaffold protein n=1 Tax=Sphingorhabdus sp. Alg239-R122 TaxID=2305989 RepID=UPI0013D9BA7B|nr:iron-sulfur cluster assembly scaffold protein [Sphingorhabdus sp. Alg239-R122]